MTDQLKQVSSQQARLISRQDDEIFDCDQLREIANKESERLRRRLRWKSVKMVTGGVVSLVFGFVVGRSI